VRVHAAVFVRLKSVAPAEYVSGRENQLVPSMQSIIPNVQKRLLEKIHILRGEDDVVGTND
jgi:hypothetical protein